MSVAQELPRAIAPVRARMTRRHAGTQMVVRGKLAHGLLAVCDVAKEISYVKSHVLLDNPKIVWVIPRLHHRNATKEQDVYGRLPNGAIVVKLAALVSPPEV